MTNQEDDLPEVESTILGVDIEHVMFILMAGGLTLANLYAGSTAAQDFQALLLYGNGATWAVIVTIYAVKEVIMAEKDKEDN